MILSYGHLLINKNDTRYTCFVQDQYMGTTLSISKIDLYDQPSANPLFQNKNHLCSNVRTLFHRGGAHSDILG